MHAKEGENEMSFYPFPFSLGGRFGKRRKALDTRRERETGREAMNGPPITLQKRHRRRKKERAGDAPCQTLEKGNKNKLCSKTCGRELEKEQEILIEWGGPSSF